MSCTQAYARIPLGKNSRFILSCRAMHQSALLKAAAPGKQPAKNTYSPTLLLPKTPFPLRADAAKREHMFRDRCTKDLYQWQLKNNPKELFVLHDGPPYANGDVHMGHALNKILKDIIIRYKVLQGHKVHYIPGWDCHGLPIELKALESLKSTESKKMKPSDIRRVAKERALKEVEKQKADFMSWGVMGDWDNPYKTLDKGFEIRQLRVFNEMVKKGYIYRQLKPVYWSPSSQTALAESELEYNDHHLSRSVYVRFPIVEAGKALESIKRNSASPLYALIWSTTPWTLPANRAISVHNDLIYTVLDVKTKESNNETYIVAKDLVESVLAKLDAVEHNSLGEITGADLVGATYKHVLNGETMPVISAQHVTAESGTGLVHTAPGHGMEDYEACRELGILPFSPVNGEGYFTADAGKQFQGLFAFEEGNSAVIDYLKEVKGLVKEEPYKHKYPYDWRTKKPVMLRATAQWFANVGDLQQDAVKALGDVRMIPSVSSRRLEQFTLSRKEWCISRQRAWGVPIPVLYNNEDGKPLLTDTSIAHIIKMIDEKGIDSWWTENDDMLFVAPEYKTNGEKYFRGYDTMDVWFDSGTSWTLVDGLEGRSVIVTRLVMPLLRSLTQHFVETLPSLLPIFIWKEATNIAAGSNRLFAVKSKSPYSTLLTHGFLLDERGLKMSKSLGNIILPSSITKGGKDLKKNPAYGTDILRLWVASTEFTRDVSVGPNVIAQVSEVMRKVRTTVRFMLGNLSDFDSTKAAPYEQLKHVDQYMLHELNRFTDTMTEAYEAYNFNGAMQALQNFNSNALSSFYFDVVKDRLYNDTKDAMTRRTAQTVLAAIVNAYTLTLAPVACHTAEEIYEQYKSLTEQPQSSNSQWNNPTVKAEYDLLRSVKGEVNQALELARQDKTIRSSQEAVIDVYCANPSSETAAILQKYETELASLFLTSDAKINLKEAATVSKGYQRECAVVNGDNIIVTAQPAVLHKCPRCWNYHSEKDNTLCGRCASVLKI
ncbi:hypothetical protein INT43_007994 [Umbelopsis isabellina]|uniref:isoleucine--tRNA ligase n=1 Tax=Mortierella isabellina TaxID=91625 RepID=A0A8H7UDA1_MORIS|nr:hypothetical protein INT43_007994 [Umbelopsis isabellina]